MTWTDYLGRTQQEKMERLRAIYERERDLRQRAKYVIKFGEPKPKTIRPDTYVETATAAAIRKVFEEGERE